MKLLTSVTFLVLVTWVDAFAPTPIVVPPARSSRSLLDSKHLVATRIVPGAAGSKPRVAPLYYRALDEQDDDPENPATLKLKSRAPKVGFKLREMLSDSASQRNVAPVKPRNALNKPLINLLRTNQYVLLALATVVSAIILLVTQGPDAFTHLDEIVKWTGSGSGLFDFKVTGENLLLGIGGAMPMLAFSNAIESSDKREFSNLNFATIVLALTLFGRRSVPPDDFLPPSLKAAGGKSKIPTTKSWEALVASFSLSAVTGFCEESIFRRQVPALLAQIFPGSFLVPFVGQAALFGLGHVQPSQKLSENALMFSLQFVNGLAFGLILLLSGGQLVAPMIAHATYDFVTFFKTWNDANTQLEYSEKMYTTTLPPDIEREVQAVLRANPKMKSPQVFNTLKRLFFTFDFDKSESLNLSEVKKGMAYYALEKRRPNLAPDSEIERIFKSTVQSRVGIKGQPKDRLTFPDFLRFFATITRGDDKLKLAKGLRDSISAKVEEVKKELVSA